MKTLLVFCFSVCSCFQQRKIALIICADRNLFSLLKREAYPSDISNAAELDLFLRTCELGAGVCSLTGIESFSAKTCLFRS